MAKEIQQNRLIGFPRPFHKKLEIDETYIHGFSSWWDATGRERFRGLCTTGIPSKTSMKTMYTQAQHKEKADLVYQNALAIK